MSKNITAYRSWGRGKMHVGGSVFLFAIMLYKKNSPSPEGWLAGWVGGLAGLGWLGWAGWLACGELVSILGS